jgi:hypothetical protein
MNVNDPHPATRLFNTPFAITPCTIELIVAALAGLFRPDGELVAFDGNFDADVPAR